SKRSGRDRSKKGRQRDAKDAKGREGRREDEREGKGTVYREREGMALDLRRTNEGARRKSWKAPNSTRKHEQAKARKDRIRVFVFRFFVFQIPHKYSCVASCSWCGGRFLLGYANLHSQLRSVEQDSIGIENIATQQNIGLRFPNHGADVQGRQVIDRDGTQVHQESRETTAEPSEQ